MPGHINHEETIGVDPMSKEERSTRMSKVRGKGNASTEIKVERVLLNEDIPGWEKHPPNILGKPDFFFPDYNLAVFVDGCFWHGCPVCKRRTPKSEFWKNKLITNIRRDNRVHRNLRKQGYHVMRIWEHELKTNIWLKRLRSMMRRIERKDILLAKNNRDAQPNVANAKEHS